MPWTARSRSSGSRRPSCASRPGPPVRRAAPLQRPPKARPSRRRSRTDRRAARCRAYCSLSALAVGRGRRSGSFAGTSRAGRPPGHWAAAWRFLHFLRAMGMSATSPSRTSARISSLVTSELDLDLQLACISPLQGHASRMLVLCRQYDAVEAGTRRGKGERCGDDTQNRAYQVRPERHAQHRRRDVDEPEREMPAPAAETACSSALPAKPSPSLREPRPGIVRFRVSPTAPRAIRKTTVAPVLRGHGREPADQPAEQQAAGHRQDQPAGQRQRHRQCIDQHIDASRATLRGRQGRCGTGRDARRRSPA